MSNWTIQDWLNSLSVSLAAVTCKTNETPASLEDASKRVCEILVETKAADGFVWWIGNGGSASLCGHFAQDLVNKTATRSMTLSDVGLLTCMANDYGFGEVYSRPLSTLIGPADTLVAISSSGRSTNILRAVDLAAAVGANVVTFSGMDPSNPLGSRPAAATFHLASQIYGIVEIGHSALIHAIIDRLYIVSHPDLGFSG